MSITLDIYTLFVVAMVSVLAVLSLVLFLFKKLITSINLRFDRLEAETQFLRKEQVSIDNFRTRMPLEYVWREEFVRNQTLIECKLDALYKLIEVSQGKKG